MSRDTLDKLLRTYVGSWLDSGATPGYVRGDWAKTGPLARAFAVKFRGYSTISEVLPYMSASAAISERHMTRRQQGFEEQIARLAPECRLYRNARLVPRRSKCSS